MKTGKYTIRQFARHRIRVKKSLFIGSVAPAKSVAEAEIFISKIKNEFADATHNCFAYRMDTDTFRYYDDGEPSGTAGMPLFRMLQKYDLYQVAIVVTRYFGGTKLGTGGLVRAYSQCAEETISYTDRIPLIDYLSLKIIYPYTLTNQVQKILHQFPVEIRKSEFLSDVEMQIDIPLEWSESFEKAIRQLGIRHSKIERN